MNVFEVHSITIITVLWYTVVLCLTRFHQILICCFLIAYSIHECAVFL